jgi:hypothetical protein
VSEMSELRLSSGGPSRELFQLIPNYFNDVYLVESTKIIFALLR